MANSGKVLHQLKVAGNYSKLAFRKDGPHSFKRDQGALIKVTYKFGKDGTISFRKLCKVLDLPCDEVRDCVKKAQESGYVVLCETKKGKHAVSLTEKGREVLAKRLEAEDRTADEILRGFSEEELDQLLAACNRIAENCKGMGVDYRVIRVKRNGMQGRIAEYGGDGESCKHGHGEGCKHGHGEGCKHGGHGEGRKHGHGEGRKHGGHGEGCKQADKKSCHRKDRGKKGEKKPVADWKGKKASYCKKVCKEDAEKCKCYRKHQRAHCKKHHGRK